MKDRHRRQHNVTAIALSLFLGTVLCLPGGLSSPAAAGPPDTESSTPAEPGTEVSDLGIAALAEDQPTWDSLLTAPSATLSGKLGPKGIYRVFGKVSGIPKGQEVKITAQVWPNNYVMTNFPGGGWLWPLGEATVENGSFDIKLSADPYFTESLWWVNALPGKPYAYINMQLLVQTQGKYYPLDVPIFVGDLTSLKSADNPMTPSLIEHVQGQPEASAANKAFLRTGPNSVHIAFELLEKFSASVPCRVGYYPSQWLLVETLKPEWVIVGQSFSNTPNVDATFEYENGQESELGTTLIAADGTIKANAGISRTLNLSAKTTWGTESGIGDHFYRTKFNVKKYQATCHNTHILEIIKTNVMQIRAVSQYGGAETTPSTNRFNAKNCAPYKKWGRLR